MKTIRNLFFLVLIPLLLLNCTPKSDSYKDNEINTFTYLALGDSYTIGESVEISLRWPIQLADSLKTKGFKADAVDIVATTGWTTAELQKGIDSTSGLEETYDLVSLLIGVNNQYRGYDIEIYREEFRELLEQAIEFAGGEESKVFVVSIPNYGVTPFGSSNEETIRKELLEYDAIAESIASEYDIPFVNITPISELAKEDSTLIAEDRLHPSGKMYSLWVSEMLPVVQELLKQ